jgi:hypothetical protein
MTDPRTAIAAIQEFYIRKEGDEDSRGPFSLEQLASLIEAGQVDRQTFYYDSVAEKWVEIQSNLELVQILFPVKKKLAVRQKDLVETISLNGPEKEDEEPITVEGMLAAAEGNTEETKGKRNRTRDRARAAQWAMRFTSVMLLASAAGLLVNNLDKVAELELFQILTTPEIVIGAVDLLLAVILFLEWTEIYPVVRVRAAMGIGFFAVYFGALPNQGPALAAVLLGSVAAFTLTTMWNIWAVIVIGLLGLAGMGGFAYCLLN